METDYKKLYEDALERAKQWSNGDFGHSVDDTPKSIAEFIFPQLKESKDERIRKAIYNCVKWFGFDSHYFKNVSQEECLSWLEKQGESKWSVNDERILYNIHSYIDYAKDSKYHTPEKMAEAKVWLDSLENRVQSHWKPTKEE